MLDPAPAGFRLLSSPAFLTAAALPRRWPTACESRRQARSTGGQQGKARRFQGSRRRRAVAGGTSPAPPSDTDPAAARATRVATIGVRRAAPRRLSVEKGPGTVV